MQGIQYFKSSWGDIKNSPGWFGKLCILALLLFIPVFGAIVAYGYLYGWAREIAWGTHEPMPTRIFGNEDGKLYRRGWFILVLMFVAGFVPYIVMQVGGTMQGLGAVGAMQSSYAAGGGIVALLGGVIVLVGFLGAILLNVLAWIGSMRISIYDRLSAGFQIGKLWKMLRHDTSGILRIFGMNLLVSFIIGIVLSIIYFIFMFAVIFAGLAGLAASGYNIEAVQYMSDRQAAALAIQLIASVGIVGFIGFLAVAFLTLVGTAFVLALTARATGYWTMQFGVAQWRGQDDPMPFELAANVGAAQAPQTTYYTPDQPAYNPYAQQGQPMQQPQDLYQPQQPQQAFQQQPMQQPQDLYQPQQPSVAEQAYSEQVSDAVANEVNSSEDAVSTENEVGAPGQLAGFTYGGTAMPSNPVTPTGADPSNPEIPDLLVVVPETPVESDLPAEEGAQEQSAE